jgi:SMC interacting uncharacterized protein involved in chromosome segregation
MNDATTITAVIFGLLGSLKLLLDLWKSHFAHTPPLHRQFADREEIRIELERLHIKLEALRKEDADKRANLHRRIDAVAESLSRLSGQLETHLTDKRS